MPETLEKLRPDRDLQCYFERPSAIAALSEAGPAGFKVSGSWRQQFDWTVIEWNRDNVFEHPAFRNLPDSDLSGLQLTYEETRQNVIPMDSDLFPTVDWPYLRIWTRDNGVEDFYRVRLRDHATAIQGTYVCASLELELQGSITAGDYIGISFLEEHHTYQVNGADTLDSAVQAVVNSVNAFSTRLAASRTLSRLRLTYVGEGQTLATSTTGVQGNRLGAYAFVSGAGTESWSPWWGKFSGGQSPTKWRVSLNFNALTAIDSRVVPASKIRKMRWTYAADLQDGAYVRSEFLVVVSSWAVTGTNRVYSIAGPGSRRIEDDDPVIVYGGSWTRSLGNFSGGFIRSTTTPASSLTITYTCPLPHQLFLGTRLAFSGASITTQVDGGAAVTESLLIPGEDVLARLKLGSLGPGTHTVAATHAGPAGSYFYFDFVEIAIPATTLPSLPADSKVTLATDWDTDHSIAIPPERTAWMIHSLGYRGRANHYVGALWFYDLVRTGHVYASVNLDFIGTPQFSQVTQVTLGRTGETQQVVISHVNRIGDTAQTLAKNFELHINRGYTALRAVATGTRLTIHAREMGASGNLNFASASPAAGAFHVVVSTPAFAGGTDGTWHTDLQAVPRLNRAVRDWSRAFYIALKNYAIDVAAAFSLELQHGNPSIAAGIAQRYPNGDPVLLNTPALQTNFSPTSAAFWKQVYLEMAALEAEAGLQPYLQFGEVQWWYFELAGSGMTFYDTYTKDTFQNTYGHSMAVIPSHTSDPALYPEEVQFLPGLIGAFTSQVMTHVRGTYSNCRFEVLYPTDVNNTPLNQLINYPAAHWTPATLDCLKTESFTFTFLRNLDLSRVTVDYGETRGFPRSKRSFLVGIGDAIAPWKKEVEMARADNVESIVLFALDQYCLIGYATPVTAALRRCAVIG